MFFLHRRVTGFVQTWKMISLEPSVQSKSSSRPLPDDDHELLCPEQSPLHIALENKNLKNSILNLVGFLYLRM